MRRRGKAEKNQRAKSLGRRITAKGVRRRKPSTVNPTERIALLTRERDEALEQQTATSEVLKVLSRSMFDLQPVLDTLVEKAVRLSGADRGFIFRQDGDLYRVVASFGHSKEFIEIAKQNPIHQDRGSATGRAILERGTVHIHDIQADPEYRWAEDHSGEEEMHRTILAVPMLRESEITGVIVIRRIRVQPFTEKQIELVTNFAAQAVIAIENTRLFNELRESLQQQTATSEVLKAISSFPGELEPVFNTMLANATRICEAKFGHLFLREADGFRAVALQSVGDTYPDWLRRGSKLVDVTNPQGPLAQIARTKKVVHITDLTAEQAYIEGNARMAALVESSGARTLLGVPMLKDDELIGAIAIYRQEVNPFTDKQIELIKNFAAQAVIAIENTRLLKEQRESLERQTATAEVLSIISSSPGELQPVFDAMLQNATRICEATLGGLFLYKGDAFRAVAVHGDSYYADWSRREPDLNMRADVHKGTPLERLTRTKKFLHIHDLRADEAYLSGNPQIKALVESAGARTHLVVPMLKDDELVGAIVIYRQEVRPFGDKQIELVQNFAAQAVIAIENTRLLNELRKSLQQQTATAEVLKVISRSTFDLRIVLRTLVEFGCTVVRGATSHCNSAWRRWSLQTGCEFWFS